jgi:hypothetical protein
MGASSTPMEELQTYKPGCGMVLCVDKAAGLSSQQPYNGEVVQFLYRPWGTNPFRS